MSAVLLGDTPRLLLRASPIVYVGPDRHRRGWIGLVEQVLGDGRARIAWNAGVHSVEKLEYVALDLTDATGRAHAAWWVRRHATDREMSPQEAQAIRLAVSGSVLHPDEIDLLARLCLRLAGRAS